ncbi:Uncharacterised protein [Vibrio cholerae]|nr:Uncharacterised protein [Vibrio cholerae]CSI67419.1 Uncharacterised protein [Vibrio cholerae]CSI68189.1 Uncharacterised protein [Vibrio cholerae]
MGISQSSNHVARYLLQKWCLVPPSYAQVNIAWLQSVTGS